MIADRSIYDSDRLALCYASERPAVHALICERVFAALPRGYEIRCALDVGCGAGASSLAIASRARHVTGVDPFLKMLQHAREKLPGATFISGSAEALPVQSTSFDLVTAAGSLNYCDIQRSLAEIARVLCAGAYFAAYDFGTGRVVPEDAPALACFKSFERRFPWPPGYPLDLANLPCREHGLDLELSENFAVDIEMDAETYIRYIMGETNVEAAIRAENSEQAARAECCRIFEPLFAEGRRKIRFEAVLALARKQRGA